MSVKRVLKTTYSLDEGSPFFKDQYVETNLHPKQLKNNNLALVKHQRPAEVTQHWSRESPVVVRGMVRARDVLFAAGPTWASEASGEGEPTFEAEHPAALIAVGVAEGRDLASCELPSQPVFDGLIAARGRLYAALADGSVVALAK